MPPFKCLDILSTICSLIYGYQKASYYILTFLSNNWYHNLYEIAGGAMDTKQYLYKIVTVKMDRPLGTKHPKHGWEYPVNYGYIPGTVSGDGEELDAYVLGPDVPLDEFTGRCIAIIHRTNDNDDKLVVVPDGLDLDDDTIEQETSFQEKWFEHVIIRE